MLKIPRIALLDPSPEEEGPILEALHRHRYSLRQAASLQYIRELQADEGAPFDALLVPLQLADLSSGISACVQTKADSLLAATPILALCPSKDKALIEAFYGAGADVVLACPFDSDMLFLQIGALVRLKRHYDELLNQGCQDSGMLHPVTQAFHNFREGLLLMDANMHIIFANAAANQLLGLHAANLEEDFARVAPQFMPFLKQHRSVMQSQMLHDDVLPPSSIFETALRRIDTDAFKASLSITSLLRDRHAVMGYSVAVIDLSEIQHLANTLMLALRTRSLCLLTSAACLRLLDTINEGGRISPIPYLEQLLQQEPRSCSLGSTLTALLEAIDLVINPKIAVKVQMEQDLHLAVRRGDFFQLIGHLLLHAVEFAGISGETIIHTTPNVPGEGVCITISAESRRVTPFQDHDQISRLIHSDFSQIDADNENIQRLGLGLLSAQQLAEKYRSTLQYQQTSDALIRVRVKLPVGSGR